MSLRSKITWPAGFSEDRFRSRVIAYKGEVVYYSVFFPMFGFLTVRALGIHIIHLV
jgi:hypothetical protein